MSSTELIFMYVFAAVAAAVVLTPLIWAAVLDGRYHAEQQARAHRMAA